MKKEWYLIALISAISTLNINAQAHLLWHKHYNGPGNSWDQAQDMKFDHDGNIIVTGITGTHGSTSIHFDIITIKYAPSGDTLWTRIYKDSEDGTAEVAGMAIDDSNNIYLTGFVERNDGKSILTLKYNPNGYLIWIREYGEPNIDFSGKTILFDNETSIYVVGNGGYVNAIYVLKYNTNGDTLWTRALSYSSGGTVARCAAMDNFGNIFIGGDYQEFGAFSYTNFITVKYLPTGDTAWARIYQGPSAAFDFITVIKTDDSGGVYVSGLSEADHGGGPEGDYATIKYDNNGNEKWISRYDGGYGGDWPVDLIIDSSGGVYVTGWSISESYTKSTATLKYDSLGTLKWIKRYDGIGCYFNDPSAMALAPDNILLIATRVADTEFTNDWMIIAYRRSDGDSLWAVQYDGTGTMNDIDSPKNIIADGQGYFYVTGFTDEINHDWDITTIKYQCPALDVRDPVRGNPDRYSLSQNYPNPFNPTTNIKYSLKENVHVSLKIYNSLGQEVRTLVNEKQSAGLKQVMWDGKNNQGNAVPSGLYICRIAAGNYVKSNKMMLIK